MESPVKSQDDKPAMSHDVFISYSHRDKPIADSICARLEADRLSCWIAPRNIDLGDDWPTAIENGIAGSRMMVLVFSQNSNISAEVSRELDLAANGKLIIIPFAIEDVAPEADKAFTLARTHWLEATNPPTDKQIGQLIERIHSLMEHSDSTDEAARELDFGRRVHQKRPWIIPVGLILMAVLLLGGISIIPKIMAAFPVGLSASGSIDPSFLPFREDFNDPKFDGGIPPNWNLPVDWCSNMKVMQENGSLTFQVPAKTRPQCSMGPESGFVLRQIKAVEFSISVSPETPAAHSPFSFMLAGQEETQTSIFLICGLAGAQSGCSVKQDQRDVYRTKTFREVPGVGYTFRIEVLDPDQMSFRFVANGETIGEYTLLPADVPIYKDMYFRIIGGVVDTNDNTRAGLYLLDYLAIEQR
jgi:hypothetical protein